MHFQHFVITAGEDRTLSMTARNPTTHAVVDLTGATITWRLSANRGDGADIEKTGSIVSAGSGTFTVALTDSDTDDLEEGLYWHQAIITVSGTTTVGVQGRVRVLGENQ